MRIISPQQIDEPRHAHIIDVREPDEYVREHIPGSRNIPLGQLPAVAGDLSNQPVIVTCRSGNRARQAVDMLQSAGCQDVSLLEGGLQGWKRVGKPTRSLKKGFSIMQQVQMVAGSMILAGSFIKALWFLAPLAGFGLLVAGLTNTCLMATLLSKMPWNRQAGDNPGSCTLS